MYWVKDKYPAWGTRSGSSSMVAGRIGPLRHFPLDGSRGLDISHGKICSCGKRSGICSESVAEEEDEGSGNGVELHFDGFDCKTGLGN